MDNIIEPSNYFLFDELHLGHPINVSSGCLFTKLFFKNKPLFIQTPKSLSKQGFIKSNKKTYIDLLYDINDTIFITWLEKLENKIIDLLYDTTGDWFENKIEKNEIETFFTSPIKLYKSGNFYLLRVNVKQNIHIYNENNEIVLLENITNEKHIISILEIKGIKFTNKSFVFDIEMKQSMIVSPDPFLDACYIKPPTSINSKKNESEPIKDTQLINFNDDESVNKLESIMKKLENNNRENEENINSLEENTIKDIITENNDEDKINNVVTFDLPIEKTKDVEEIENSKSNNNDDYEILTIYENKEEDDEINKTPTFDFEDLGNDDSKNIEEIKKIRENIDEEPPLKLINANEVYCNIYKETIKKAKEFKNKSINAYMEAENIKKMYGLEIENIDSSEED